MVELKLPKANRKPSPQVAPERTCPNGRRNVALRCRARIAFPRSPVHRPKRRTRTSAFDASLGRILRRSGQDIVFATPRRRCEGIELQRLLFARTDRTDDAGRNQDERAGSDGL